MRPIVIWAAAARRQPLRQGPAGILDAAPIPADGDAAQRLLHLRGIESQLRRQSGVDHRLL